MRNLKIALLTFAFCLNVFAGAGGHGGDPYLTIAEVFPDQEKLENAYAHAVNKIEQAPLKTEFKQSILEEMRLIKDKKLFLYLENVIIISKDGDDTYKLPEDARSFLSLGAMTGENRGDAIYFSKRSLKHELEAFSKLLIHEILHHVSISVLSQDEGFIEELADGIMKGKISKAIEYAYQEGIYIRPGVIKADQIFYKLNQNFPLTHHQGLLGNSKYSEEEIKHELKKFVQTFPSGNSFDSNLVTVFKAVAEARFAPLNYEMIYAERMIWEIMKAAFEYEGKKMNWHHYTKCKVQIRFYETCSNENSYRISDLFK